jgi:hypothetical protein
MKIPLTGKSYELNISETVQEIARALYDKLEERRTTHLTKANAVIDDYKEKKTNNDKAYNSVKES